MVLLKQVGSHPHIISMLGVLNSMPPAVVLEYASRGDLRTYIRRLSAPPPLQMQLRVLCEIADALAFLAQRRVVHRDVAARNCLLHEDGRACLGDFGMSRVVQSNEYGGAPLRVWVKVPNISMERLVIIFIISFPFPSYYKQVSDQAVPLRWMAIETLRQRKYTVKSDVWWVVYEGQSRRHLGAAAFPRSPLFRPNTDVCPPFFSRAWGVLAWEVTNKCRVPYGALGLDDIVRLLLSGQRLELASMPASLAALVSETWSERAEDRPTPAAVFRRISEVSEGFIIIIFFF